MKRKTEDGNPLRVKILGSEYRIKRKVEEDSYYEKIAKYVDEKMRNVVEKTPLISIDKVAVLAALRICEELFRVKEHREEKEKFMRKKIKEMTEMIGYTLRVVLVFLLIPFILTSCVTGRRAIPPESPQPPLVKGEKEGSKGKYRKGSRSPRLRRGQTVGEKKQKHLTAAKQYGEITANSVNMRAGANMNYEILGKLRKGDKVSIVSTAFGWSEIELSGFCLGWIYKDYVSTEDTPSKEERVIGVVTGNSVRVRARPGLRYTVLTKVNKGDKVTVVDLQGDWFGIEPPENCTGWVSSDYVRVLPR